MNYHRLALPWLRDSSRIRQNSGDNKHLPRILANSATRTLAALGLLLAAESFTLAQPAAAGQKAEPPDITETDAQAAAQAEAALVTQLRQLTFEGRRAGEGYFSRDGAQMVFQSEREPGNPFYQIYRMDLETGDVRRISPGYGKTTCSWIHPTGRKVLFSSTHEDPQARQKQVEEIKRRESGKQQRYAWDYDEHYDIFEYDCPTGRYRNLTKTRGYDAEGSWSPDGKLIAFASNRRGYEEKLDEEQRKKFEADPAWMMDIYVIDADGKDVRRLTDAPGYDGGPFFSPDGRRICWRRFSEDGATAEIFTMNADGSDQRQLTRLGVMSWAPFYHPSGEYLIFTTNRHGFGNFELYLVDVGGKSAPVRASFTKGFDGLPAFSPDGKRLSWTSSRTPTGESQIFLAQWNHGRALRLLGLAKAPPNDNVRTRHAPRNGAAHAERGEHTVAEYSPRDVRRHVEYLCRPELTGRLTGTPGEKLATEYVAACFEKLGLKPAGDDGSWFQPFEFTAAVALGGGNRLAWGSRHYELNKDWRPVAFSQTGTFPPAPVVFAGYGISAPASEGRKAYDSFVHLDVAGKWVLALRYLPEGIPAEQRQPLAHHANLRSKAMAARDRGARGLIVVSGPNSQAKNQLVPLQLDGALAGSSIPVVSVTDNVVAEWMAASGKDLKQLQDRLDRGEPMIGFPLKGVELSAAIQLEHVKRTGRNVLGRLQSGQRPSDQVIVVGAHVDHLGTGPSSSSLARGDQQGGIHFGADDNASGVAAMLEIAEYLADRKAAGQLGLKRDLLFAAWSGEELGTLGSAHFVQKHRSPLYPVVTACLNMDMVGRLDKKLMLQGVGSSGLWAREIEQRNVPVGLPISVQLDAYLPSDATPFYIRGVPILSAFTGAHGDYHTPGDTPEKLNYEGTARIARLMGLVARSLAARDAPPDYVAQSAPKQGPRRAGLRSYLGTVPDYAAEGRGLKLAGVVKDGPAAKAGLRAGDVVVELAGKKIDNVYDYTYALEALKIGQKTSIAVLRNGTRLTLEITPGSRE